MQSHSDHFHFFSNCGQRTKGAHEGYKRGSATWSWSYSLTLQAAMVLALTAFVLTFALISDQVRSGSVYDVLRLTV